MSEQIESGQHVMQDAQSPMDSRIKRLMSLPWTPKLLAETLQKTLLQTEEIGELAAALAKAQGEMKPAPRSSSNPFFGSSYADLAAIVEAARGPLARHGLAVIQTTERDGTVTTMLAHASGQWIRGELRLRSDKDTPQAIGSAITYARRYAFAAIVGVVAEGEDDDAEHAEGRTSSRPNPPARHSVKQRQAATPKAVPAAPAEPERQRPARPITEGQERLLWARAKKRSKELGLDDADAAATILHEVLWRFKVEHVKETQQSQLDPVLQALDSYELGTADAEEPF